MRDYEAIFILKAALSEDASKTLVAAISAEITKNGGTIDALEHLGKKSLAYIVKKHKEGSFVKVDFKLDPAKITDVKKIYRLNEDILKLSVIKK